MADNVVVSAGTGTTIAADEVTDGTLGSCKVQMVKIMDGALGGTDKLTITTADGALVNLGTNNDVTVTGSLTTVSTVTTCSTVTTLSQFGGNAINLGAGAVGTGTLRTTLASDDPAVASLALLDNAISGAGFNITQFAGAAVPIGAGVEATAVRVTIATDSTGVISIDDNGGAITVDGAVTVTNATAANLKAEVTVAAAQTIAVTNAGTFAVQPTTATSGGESSLSALSTAAVYTAEVKGSAGQVYSVDLFNKGAAAVYVRLYNQTGAPASTDGANIVWRGILPGNTAGAGFIKEWPNGKAFSTGIGIRVSGAIADNDTTVLAANEVTVNVGYK